MALEIANSKQLIRIAPNRRLNAAYLTTSIMDSREISSEVWHSFGGASKQINKSQPSWDVIETLLSNLAIYPNGP